MGTEVLLTRRCIIFGMCVDKPYDHEKHATAFEPRYTSEYRGNPIV